MSQKMDSIRSLGWKRKIAIASLLMAGFLILTPLATYAYFARDISDRERLMNRNNTGIVLLDRNGETFYSFGKAKNEQEIPLEQISDDLEKALIASEDKNFYEHSGFSFTATLGALYANFVTRDSTAYGGSTITQQLAKNTLLSDDKNYLRKYQELSIAIAIERQYSKDDILEMYLNSVYFGEGAFGINDAAQTYYGKTPAELNLAESSMLIGLLPAPSAYSPINGDPELAAERQNTVLSRMVDNDVIAETDKAAALSTQLSFAPASAVNTNDAAPHFAEMVLEELYERYGEEQVARSGYQVTTSLDLNWQNIANNAVSAQMPTIIRGGGSNASMIAIDPKSGEIRALVGSSDWNNEQFGKVNMAVTPRQPGSSFKPIYFTEALQNQVITPATVIADEPTEFGGGYKPENYDFRYRGDITVRNALSQSLNIPAVKVMEDLGVEEAVEAAERMGLTTVDDPQKYGLSLALGAAETKLNEMTNVYAAFANQGIQHSPTTITKINNKFDRTIFSYSPKEKRVMSQGASFLISDILSDNSARSPTFGASLNIAGRDVAVKTGTTDDSRDAWTIGYTPSLAIGVWVGNNDNTVMRSGGSGMAGPIWRSTMQQFLQGTPSETFTRPSDVQQINICSNGRRASSQFDGTRTEFFLASTVPQQTCDAPRIEPEVEEEPEQEVDETQDDADQNDGNNQPDEEPVPPEEEEEPTPPGTGTPSTPVPTPTPGPNSPSNPR